VLNESACRSFIASKCAAPRSHAYTKLRLISQLRGHQMTVIIGESAAYSGRENGFGPAGPVLGRVFTHQDGSAVARGIATAAPFAGTKNTPEPELSSA
jgi:hypothetical protein